MLYGSHTMADCESTLYHPCYSAVERYFPGEPDKMISICSA